MNIGRLKKRIAIERQIFPEQNSYGEVTGEWSELGELWAEIRPTAGQETHAGDTTTPIVSHEITVRVPTHFEAVPSGTYIVANDRIKYGSRILEIVSVRKLYEKDQILIMNCQEVTQ